MEEKKKYIIPTIEIVEFIDKDIITVSLGEQNGNWEDDDNGEHFGS